MSQKVHTLKLSVTLSNLNRVSTFFALLESVKKFATKPYAITHLTLGALLHYLEKFKIQMKMQIAF